MKIDRAIILITNLILNIKITYYYITIPRYHDTTIPRYDINRKYTTP